MTQATASRLAALAVIVVLALVVLTALYFGDAGFAARINSLIGR